MNDKKIMLSAIDQTYSSNVPRYTEEKARSKDFINYGADNKWPNYLWDLYNNVATLQSVINGCIDYTCGNGIVFKWKTIVNNTGETIEDVIRKISTDYFVFGGFALQVIRNLGGEVNEIYALDFMKVRSDEKNEVFYYCDDWSKWGAKSKVYPKFGINDSNPTSIFYYKGNVTRTVYPTPIYNAALTACELEKAINEFHLNNINNGFATNLIINFNNGQPNEDQKDEIEDEVNEKFSGYQNAGRILLSFNDSADNATTIERLNDDSFDEKYSALAKRSREQIFVAFRANPCLFGVNPENNGFSKVEFNESFDLFQKTVIAPIQSIIERCFTKILGIEDVLVIEPFKVQWSDEVE